MSKRCTNTRAQKAYFNPKFMGGRDARSIRILSEYLEPLARFQQHGVRDSIVFFGSARARPPDEVQKEHRQALAERKKLSKRVPKELRERLQRIESDRSLARYYGDSRELSKLLTRWARSLGTKNRFVICSGGGPGIMESANRGATADAGGKSIGLAISLPEEEDPNKYITPDFNFEFHYFFMRKLWFLYLAAAVVVFPGGMGTMDELFEVLTLRQTRKIHRPLPTVLYGSRYWKDVLDFEAMIRWGVIAREDLDLFRVCDTPKEAFGFLKRELLRHYPKPKPIRRGL